MKNKNQSDGSKVKIALEYSNNIIATLREPFVLIAVTTLATIAISIYCLASGYFIIFQNLFYIPIIIACLYFLLTIAFTRESSILLQAFVRVLIFVLVAGVITYLSLARKRVEESLRRQHDNLEDFVQERTAQLEEVIAKRKQANEELNKIEWLLKPKVFQADTFTPFYGDVTKCNTDRTILDALGAETIKNIINEFMGLMGTSSAVYEKNGDYAGVIFSSGWCRFLDDASFKLCNTVDLKQALNCGKWRCHESCWTEASKKAIETGLPTDIECAGGIHLYVIPICLGNEIIGSINVGHGDPPKDPDKLAEIAGKYQVDIKELAKLANEYQTRPPYIIELAKHRLAGTAELIGLLVERKKAEEALSAEKANLDAVFESSPVPMFVIDDTTNIVMINLAFTVMCGGSESDILQHRPGNALRCVHSHSDPRGCGYAEACKYCNVRNGVEGLIANGGSLHGAELELELIRNGEPGKYWMNIGVEPFIMNGQGHWCIAMHDVTERKKAEEKISKFNTELEQRVADRTNELAAANKELETFSYSVSHDLRAPLRHISGYVELLTTKFHDILPEKGKHYLDSIAGSSHEMGTLIDNLLQFSRTGRAEMRKSANDMNDIVNAVIKSITAEQAECAISWKVDKLPIVQCDSALLKQVWINLLGNAVKYSRSRANIKIDIGAKEENNEYIFSVRDNGVGFEMQYAHKLFGVFQRLHPAGEFEGTGIGLANVRQIISRHGGRTWAEAELNKGATFYFSLIK